MSEDRNKGKAEFMISTPFQHPTELYAGHDYLLPCTLGRGSQLSLCTISVIF
jgi:hypothetical protein